MLETILGIWLFLMSVGAGFLLGRYVKRPEPPKRGRAHTSAEKSGEFGWQELLNFLRYDGSGAVSDERREVEGETKDHTGTDRAGIYRRRPL